MECHNDRTQKWLWHVFAVIATIICGQQNKLIAQWNGGITLQLKFFWNYLFLMDNIIKLKREHVESSMKCTPIYNQWMKQILHNYKQILLFMVL